MTIGEYADKMAEKRQPSRKECSSCGSMAACWYSKPEFQLDGVCEDWHLPEVPHYIKDLQV